MDLKPTYKNIWGIAAPIMLFQFVQNAIGFTDTIFLGRVGLVEMSACGIMAIYYLIFVMIGFGISRGAQILIARRAGEEKYGEIGNVTDHLFLFEIGMATFLFAFLHLASSYIVPWFIQSPEILEAGWEYLRYRSYGIFFSLLAFVLLAMYSGLGKTTAITYVTVTLALVNIFLNYALIFGKFGFPEMGIGGAGLASAIAEGVSAVVGLIYLYFDPLRHKIQLFKSRKINWTLMKRMTILSTPLVLQFLVGLGGWFVFFTFLENYGQQALAISVVIRWLYSFFMIPGIGAASSVNTLVSNSMGKDQFVQAILGMKRSVLFSFIATFLLAAVLFIFPEAIANIFTDDAGIISETPKLYPVLASILLVSSVSTVVFNGLMGTGATSVSLIIELVAVVLYLSYAYVIINVWEKSLGMAWFSEFLYWGFLLLFTLIYFYFGNWKKKRL